MLLLLALQATAGMTKQEQEQIPILIQTPAGKSLQDQAYRHDILVRCWHQILQGHL